MPLIYRVIARQKPGTEDPENKKYYLSRNSTGLIKTETIAHEIAISAGQSEGTILGLLQDLHNEILSHLKNGYSVRLGNIGILHPTITSWGEETEEEVDASSVSKINVRFIPSIGLKKSVELTNSYLDFKEIGTVGESEALPDEPGGGV